MKRLKQQINYTTNILSYSNSTYYILHSLKNYKTSHNKEFTDLNLNKSFTYKLLLYLIPIFFCTTGVSATDNSGNLSFQGITEPLRQATIGADFAGVISSIRKNEGTYVKKGDTIIELDFQQAYLDAERCRIIAESNAELNGAKLKSETAKLDFDATKMVHDSTRAISDEELWKKELDFNIARTECDRLSSQKSKDVIEYKMALERLRHYFVIAPFEGVVAQRFLNESESCRPQEPLIKLVDVHKCRFITYVPVIYSQGLSKGKQVSITLEGKKSPQIREGFVEFISPVVDPSSGLRTVKIVFDNSDGSIQPGVKGILSIDNN